MLHRTIEQDHGIAHVADRTLIECARPALERGERVTIGFGITNAHRTFGAMLAGEVARRFGADGLPEGCIGIEVTGTAGQSFGAFATKGMTISLEGDANDYVGKGLSGGIIAVRPPAASTFVAADNVIVGNTVLYGATSGRAFFAGRAGERFGVRNSGAIGGRRGHGRSRLRVHDRRRRRRARSDGAQLRRRHERRPRVRARRGRRVHVALQHGHGRRRGARADDEARVLALIEEHVARTGSVRGEDLLARWSEVRARFKKVIPTEYKRVLEQQRLAALAAGAAASAAVAAAAARRPRPSPPRARARRRVTSSS